MTHRQSLQLLVVRCLVRAGLFYVLARIVDHRGEVVGGPRWFEMLAGMPFWTGVVGTGLMLVLAMLGLVMLSFGKGLDREAPLHE